MLPFYSVPFISFPFPRIKIFVARSLHMRFVVILSISGCIKVFFETFSICEKWCVCVSEFCKPKRKRAEEEQTTTQKAQANFFYVSWIKFVEPGPRLWQREKEIATWDFTFNACKVSSWFFRKCIYFETWARRVPSSFLSPTSRQLCTL